jgi:hypothetical protein
LNGGKVHQFMSDRQKVSSGILILAGLSFGQLTFGQSAPGADPYQQNQSFPPQQSYGTQQSYGPPQSYGSQQPYASPQPKPEMGQLTLSPEQLDNLVAPIALYPDPLLSEVLAASTYPLEVVEAEQWLQQHANLRGPQLINAAQQTRWDPSVQALVAVPDALAMLNRDVQWTTDLGNAFLAQQADVMAAIQRMRTAAQQNGRLTNTPQQVLTNDAPAGQQYGQGAIQIQPANPQVMYVPAYNPEYVWGPPAAGAYPALGYPSDSYGLGFGVPALIGSLFTGLLSWGGWGWGLSWLTHSLLLNGLFLNHFGFGGFGGGGFGGYGRVGAYSPSYSGATVWAHNPVHRLGVPYSTMSVAGRFGGSYSGSYSNRSVGSIGYRSGMAQPASNWRSFGPGSYSSRSSNAGSFASRSPQSYGGSSLRSGFSGSSSYENRGAAYENRGAVPSYGRSGYTGASMGYREAPAQSYSRSYSSPSGSSPSRSYGYATPSYGGTTSRTASPQYSARSYVPSNASGSNFSRGAFKGSEGKFSAPKSSGRFSSGHVSTPHSSGGHSSGGHSGGHSSKGHHG